ncbi:tetratricopeptide repeat protein [bacterium]|nr:tetratricopeptide repeat protein [bacterium]
MTMKSMLTFTAILSLIVVPSCQKTSSTRKIRLSESSQTITRTEDQLTTTIHLEPSQQRSIAVMFFKNQTGDDNLEWLQQGLTEMFIRALSQSRHLSVLGQDRLVEILDRLDDDETPAVDMNLAAIVAREANVEVLLRGNISKEGDALRLNVQLIEPFEGLVLRDESIEGSGLETILSMVDQLSHRIQNDLQFSLERNEPLKGIAELSTNSLEAWQEYTLGEELCTQLLEKEAIPHYQRAIAFDSSFVSPYLKLQHCYAGQGDKEMAYMLYEMAERLKDKATKQERFQLEVTRTLLNGEVEHLLETQKAWISENPTDIQAHHDLATYYFGLRNYDKAIEYYKKTYELDPKHKLTLNMLGYCYALTGHYKKAITLLEKYRETVPDEPNPYDSLGEIYLFMGDYKKAAKYFKMAVDKNTGFGPSWNHLANTAIDRGDYSRALDYFEEELNHIADGAQKAKTMASMGTLYLRMGNKERAIESFEASQEEFMYQFRAPLEISGIYEDEGDSLKARQVLEHYYQKLKTDMTTDQKKRDQFILLALMSLRYDIEPEMSLNLIDSTMAIIDNPMQMLRAQFIKTLLLIKLERYQEIDYVWQKKFQHHFLLVMQNIQNIGYTDIWQYFQLINDLFSGNPQKGIDIYTGFIQSTEQFGLKFYEAGFRGLLADLYMRAPAMDQARMQLDIAGIPMDSIWMVIGPFDNKDGFNRKYPPEKAVEPVRTYSQGGRSFEWRHVNDGYSEGYIDLKNAFDKTDWCVAYAAIIIDSPKDQQVQLRTGSNEAIKIWLNSREVWRLNRLQDAIIDDQITPVTLLAGKNRILVKVCNRGGDWGFYFRVTDEDGNGIRDIRYIAADAVNGEIS